MNIKTLAGQLGISVSTVSKALNDSHEISPETKRKVLELAAALNYTPNAYAGSLRNKKSNNIAVVLPEVADSFFSQAINGIELVAQERGYHVLVYLTHEKLQKEQSILKDFLRGRVDGVLMSLSGETTMYDHIQQLLNNKTPMVFFDRVPEHIAAAGVVTNDFEAAYNATADLISKGCLKIAFLQLSDKLAVINRRLEGYKIALADNGIPFNEKRLVNCAGDEQLSRQAMKRLLTQMDRPDAALASSEKSATDLYAVCNETGIRIPADLKVIAFSNLQIAGLLHPPLSTIIQPAFEMGKAAATLLFKALEKSSFRLDKEQVVIPSEFMERLSSRIAGHETSLKQSRNNI